MTTMSNNYNKWQINSENEDLYNKGMEYIQALKNGSNKNLLIYGEVGRGKTLLSLVLLEAFERNYNRYSEDGVIEYRGVTTALVSIPELLTRINNSFEYREDKLSLQRYINYLKTVDLLVFDDLGRENFSENNNTYKNYLFELVDARYDSKPTIITTNLEPLQLKDKYDPAVLSRLLPRDANRVVDFSKIKDQRIA